MADWDVEDPLTSRDAHVNVNTTSDAPRRLPSSTFSRGSPIRGCHPNVSMPLLVLSFLVCKVVAQFLVQSSSNSGSVTPNSCLRRSVQVYTSDSSTFIVTDMGSTSFMATPTFCANISTIYEANGTVTVTQTAKATVSWATATEVVAAGFTKYFNETVAELSTTTSKSGSVADIPKSPWWLMIFSQIRHLICT